jgi:hypothetical protein
LRAAIVLLSVQVSSEREDNRSYREDSERHHGSDCGHSDTSTNNATE